MARRALGVRPEPILPLLANCPPDEALPHLQALLATEVADGVRVDAHVVGLEPLPQPDHHPTARAQVVARFGGSAEATLDLRFETFTVTPAPFPGLLGPIADVPQRSVESELAARVHALVDPRRYHWAAADLHEVWRLAQAQPDAAAVGAAIAAAFAAHDTPLTALDRLRTGAFGTSRSSRRDWRKLGVAVELPEVAEAVGAALRAWVA